MSEDLMVMIESLVQEHYGTQGLEYLRQRTRPAPAVQVPEGMALVQRKLIDESIARINCAIPGWEVHLNALCDALAAAAAAAPAPATVATEAVAHCGNEECGWSGPASDCVQPKHGGAVCCPECHDTAEMERIEPEPDGGQILIGEKWLSVDAPAARTWTGNTRPLFAGKAVAQGGGVDAEIARLLWNIPIRVCDGRVSMEYGYWDQVCRLLDKRRALLTAARAGVGGWQEGSE